MTKRQRTTILDLIEAGLVEAGETLVIRHRDGQRTRSSVTPAGALRLGRKEYDSPSAAASAALGGTPINGWMMWRTTSPGQSRLLSELRMELRR